VLSGALFPPIHRYLDFSSDFNLFDGFSERGAVKVF
jgi:hypothetical protein